MNRPIAEAGVPLSRRSAPSRGRLFRRCGFVVALASAGLPVAGMVGVAAWEEPVAVQSRSCLVSTANGAVQGLLRGDTCTYLGVP